MAKKPKRSAIAVRTTDEILEAAKMAAAAEMRTISGLVEKALVDWLRERGYLK